MALLMDRENAVAPGWSHVISDAATHEEQERELRAFARRIGAPQTAFQRGSWLHLDVKRAPRAKALADPAVQVFETSIALVRHLIAAGVLRGGANARGAE